MVFIVCSWSSEWPEVFPVAIFKVAHSCFFFSWNFKFPYVLWFEHIFNWNLALKNWSFVSFPSCVLKNKIYQSSNADYNMRKLWFKSQQAAIIASQTGMSKSGYFSFNSFLKHLEHLIKHLSVSVSLSSFCHLLLHSKEIKTFALPLFYASYSLCLWARKLRVSFQRGATTRQ